LVLVTAEGWERRGRGRNTGRKRERGRREEGRWEGGTLVKGVDLDVAVYLC